MAWFTVNYNNYMKEGIQNTHLAPVFNEIFPLLIAQEIKYWVYGGVAIAGVKGSFGRKNADVDVFVLEEDLKLSYIDSLYFFSIGTVILSNGFTPIGTPTLIL